MTPKHDAIQLRLMEVVRLLSEVRVLAAKNAMAHTERGDRATGRYFESIASTFNDINSGQNIPGILRYCEHNGSAFVEDVTPEEVEKDLSYAMRYINSRRQA